VTRRRALCRGEAVTRAELLQQVLAVRAITDIRDATDFLRERILKPYVIKIKYLEQELRKVKTAQALEPSRRMQAARQRIAELEAELAAKP
jgi:hypothetical protein